MISQFEFTRESDFLEYAQAIKRHIDGVARNIATSRYVAALQYAKSLVKELEDRIKYESE